jgi:hypothetical protein
LSNWKPPICTTSLAWPRAASQQHAAARFELAEIERLAQVIVGAHIQRLHAVFDAIARGQHQHWRAVAALAHAGQHAQAIQLGQADIQHHQVETSGSAARWPPPGHRPASPRRAHCGACGG